MITDVHQMAKLLGRRGGRARAESLTIRKRRAIASMGGRAANARRSKSVREKIAREAAQARWKGVRTAKLIEENARRLIVIQDLRAALR